MSTTPCRFGTKCFRKDTCRFLHSDTDTTPQMPNCRYGATCKRGNCVFTHPQPTLYRDSVIQQAPFSASSVKNVPRVIAKSTASGVTTSYKSVFLPRYFCEMTNTIYQKYKTENSAKSFADFFEWFSETHVKDLVREAGVTEEVGAKIIDLFATSDPVDLMVTMGDIFLYIMGKM
jgi:hypothetical protein